MSKRAKEKRARRVAYYKFCFEGGPPVPPVPFKKRKKRPTTLGEALEQTRG